MKDPILREIRRHRARRSKELTRDLENALSRSFERAFTWGHDVATVDPTAGELQNPDRIELP